MGQAAYDYNAVRRRKAPQRFVVGQNQRGPDLVVIDSIQRCTTPCIW